MTFNIRNGSVIVFDLDDTLYKEIDFVYSAYRHIAKLLDLDNWASIYQQMLESESTGVRPLDLAVTLSNNRLTITQVLAQYRYHFPDLNLSPGVCEFLSLARERQCHFGVITDGRSTTQRNKLAALNLIESIPDIVISEEIGSEKPCVDNFLPFERKYPNRAKYYIGDNIKKDFIAPNQLGWTTICLKNDGRNIHSQSGNWNENQLPAFYVESFQQLMVGFA